MSQVHKIFLMEEAGSSYETEGDFPAQVMMRHRKAVDAMESMYFLHIGPRHWVQYRLKCIVHCVLH